MNERLAGRLVFAAIMATFALIVALVACNQDEPREALDPRMIGSNR